MVRAPDFEITLDAFNLLINLHNFFDHLFSVGMIGNQDKSDWNDVSHLEINAHIKMLFILTPGIHLMIPGAFH